MGDSELNSSPDTTLAVLAVLTAEARGSGWSKGIRIVKYSSDVVSQITPAFDDDHYKPVFNFRIRKRVRVTGRGLYHHLTGG